MITLESLGWIKTRETKVEITYKNFESENNKYTNYNQITFNKKNKSYSVSGRTQNNNPKSSVAINQDLFKAITKEFTKIIKEQENDK